MKTVTQEQLDEVVRRLVEAVHPERIYLYGSHAYGTPSEDSDIDLLVVVADEVSNDARLYGQAASCLRGSFVPVEMAIFNRADFERQKDWVSSLPYAVARQGRLLYAA